MAKMIEDLVMKVSFEMSTDEGTNPLRDVAEHAKLVALAWADVGKSMERLADAFDKLVTQGPIEKTVGEMESAVGGQDNG